MTTDSPPKIPDSSVERIMRYAVDDAVWRTVRGAMANVGSRAVLDAVLNAVLDTVDEAVGEAVDEAVWEAMRDDM